LGGGEKLSTGTSLVVRINAPEKSRTSQGAAHKKKGLTKILILSEAHCEKGGRGILPSVE